MEPHPFRTALRACCLMLAAGALPASAQMTDCEVLKAVPAPGAGSEVLSKVEPAARDIEVEKRHSWFKPSYAFDTGMAFDYDLALVRKHGCEAYVEGYPDGGKAQFKKGGPGHVSVDPDLSEPLLKGGGFGTMVHQSGFDRDLPPGRDFKVQVRDVVTGKFMKPFDAGTGDIVFVFQRKHPEERIQVNKGLVWYSKDSMPDQAKDLPGKPEKVIEETVVYSVPLEKLLAAKWAAGKKIATLERIRVHRDSSHLIFIERRDDGLYREMLVSFPAGQAPGDPPYNEYRTRLFALAGRVFIARAALQMGSGAAFHPAFLYDMGPEWQGMTAEEHLAAYKGSEESGTKVPASPPQADDKFKKLLDKMQRESSHIAPIE